MTTIAVNTRLLIKDKLEGIGRFTFETLKRITKNHPEVQFVFIFDRPFHSEFIFSGNVTPVVVSPKARHPLLFYWWLEHRIPGVLKKVRADLFFAPDGYLSLSTKVKSHAVIHDLNFEHFPDFLPFSVRKYYQFYFPKFAQKASRIATVSEFSKGDIAKQYHISPSNIDVVYNGCSDLFKPLPEEEIQKVRARFSNGCPYFLFVGSVNPRKNIQRLLQAFELFKENKNSNFKLLIAGEKKWWDTASEKIFQEMKYNEDVIFTGRMDDRNLADVMASAEALTYVSHFEGFGIPIIEAMNCDVPVITSLESSMPEIAGDAAILIDPFSVEQIKNAMIEITENKTARNELIFRAKVQREKFSWDRTADLLWKSIEKTLS